MNPRSRTGRLAAAAGLSVLVLAASAVGQASASHLVVHADGNLVWSTAWHTPPVATIVWTGDFAHAQGDTPQITGEFTTEKAWTKADLAQCFFLFWAGNLVSKITYKDEVTAGVPAPLSVDASGHQIVINPVETITSRLGRTPQPVVLEVRCTEADASQVLVARSPYFWWANTQRYWTSPPSQTP